MNADQAAARQAERENLLGEMAAALKAARLWLNGDKWRYGTAEQRDAWEGITESLDGVIAKAGEQS